jgi:hypothetical protein
MVTEIHFLVPKEEDNMCTGLHKESSTAEGKQARKLNSRESLLGLICRPHWLCWC